MFKTGRIRAMVSRRALGGRTVAVLAATFIVASMLVFKLVQPAHAGTGLGVVPNFTGSPVTVGQTGLAASVTVTNTSTPPQETGTVTVNTLTLVPSCSNTVSNCAGGTPDPAAFTLSATGTGGAGTACAGQVFTITLLNAVTGQVGFTGATIVLQPPGSGALATCEIDFTYAVNKVPAADSNLASPGVQTNQIAEASATHQGGQPGSGFGTSAVTVLAAAPTIATNATPSITLGSTISDTASVTGVAGGPAPTGTVTFTVFGPGDATCAAAPVFTSAAQPLAGGPPTATASSGNFTPLAAGTYRWIATYSGDANYTPVTGPCNAANETSAVAAAPTITVDKTASPLSRPVPGGTFTFTIVVTNTSAAQSVTITSITDNIYGDLATRAGSNCGALIGTVLAPGASSAPCSFTGSFTGPGGSSQTDVVTVNAVDVNGTTATDTDDATVTITAATPTISTQATPTVPIGGAISDTASVTGAGGGPAPTGTVVFTVFGPGDATCAAAPVFTSAAQPLAPAAPPTATATSGPFTPTATGTYRWIASYSGDANNAPATGTCGDANETSVVTPFNPTIATNASGPVTLSQPISDTATLSGGSSPTGTITFTLFGPANPTCTGASIFTSTVAVAGNGTYPSGPFTPTAAGSYNWIASYSGDANNAPATGTCGDANETSVVTALPTINVDKTATPLSRPEPGGTFTFSVVVTNTGGEVLTITALTDNIYGNIATQGTCTNAVGTVLPAGGTYSCSFTGNFTGNAGASQTDVVTVTATNTTGVVVNDTDDATVSITDVPPTITLDKSVTPASLPEPGGTFTFTVVVGNTSTEPVTITSLTDDIYGNLTTRPGSTCTTAIGTVLPPAGTYTCTFTGNFTGAPNDTQTDTVTGTAVDDDGTTGTASDTATVTITGATLTTQASGPVVVGGAISDTATLANGQNTPTGTITFTLFGPDNAACTGAPVFTDTVAVNGNGTYPSAPFTTAAAGTYRWIAAYSGDASNSPVTTACADPLESVQVAKMAPGLTTAASGTVPVGGQISDTGTLTGGFSPTGTITFTLFGPDNPTCSGAPIFTSTSPVTSGNGTYNSAAFTTTAAGVYRWIAVYNGDANNTTAGPTACADPAETVTVTKVSPSLVTTASPDVRAGQTITDTAALSGGVNPTGTITFNVFGPDNNTCSGAPAFISTVPVNGNGNYTSGPFTPTQAGRYRWIATYNGDASNNATAPGVCTDPNERVDVAKARPDVTTQASPSVDTGGTITDTATLTGALNPGGHIIFHLFGPDNVACDPDTLVFSSTVPVTGNGAYTSAGFVPTSPGTYRWVAIYGGDPNNAAFVGSCNAPNESVLVTGTAIPTSSTTTTTPPTPPTPPTFPTTRPPDPPVTTAPVVGATTPTTAGVTVGGVTATTSTTIRTGVLSVTGANALRLARFALMLLAVGALAVVATKRPRRQVARRR
jgi:hypothetical protein